MVNFRRTFRVCIILLILLVLIPSALSDIEVHFLNVGQGDAAIVVCDGESMMIDGGQSDKSQFVYSYLRNTLGLSRLDYVIATHPDADHIGGLSAALNACEAGTIFSSTSYSDTKTFRSLVKYTEKQGLNLIIPNAGDTFQLGGATVEIIGPVAVYEDDNNGSIVLRVTYGNTSFLFTGDIEVEAESDIIRYGGSLRSTVLKVSHHGSDSSSSARFIEAVQPQYAIVSVGENSYGHPSDDVLSRLQSLGTTIYRTDINGTIICQSDGNSVSFTTERGSKVTAPAHETPTDTSAPYIGNHNSKKFHYADCSSVDDMKEKNKVEFSSREAAIDAGYVPCKRCNP